MGCTLSNGKIKYDPTEKFNFETSYRNKFMKLSKEHSDLIKYIDESHFNRGSEVDNEQINVLQYKIELLLTMLAMEDKSKEIVLNRMEAMKFMLISEGQSAQQLEELFSQYSAHSPTMIDLNYDIDISNAIEKTQIAFETNRDEIIHTFVDDFGSLRVSMSREEFIKALEAVNIKLSTKDLQILSLRFFDGLAISVPEFLSFFGHSSTQRLVRLASHAVTMSEENIDFKSVMNSTNQVSTMTQHSISKELNLSITKLVILWKHVKTALLAEFENQCNGTGRTISTAQFSDSLGLICGEGTSIRNTFSTLNLPVNEEMLLKMSALSNNDTTIISEHFEFGGRVHFSQFYLFVEEKAAMIDSHMLRQVHSIEEAAHLFEEQRTETGTTSLRSRSSVTNPRYEPVDSRAPFGTDNWYRSRSLNNSVSMQLPRSRQSPTASSNQILSERRLRDSSLYRDESKSEQERLRYSTSRLSSQDSYGKKGTAFQSTLDRPPRRPSFTTIKSMHAKSTRSSSPGVQLSGTDTPAPRLRRRSSSFSSTFTDMSKSLPAQLNHQ